MLFVTVEIDDAFLETIPAEWHDDPNYIALTLKLIGIRALDDFAKLGIALIEDYHLNLGKELGRDAVYLAGGG